MPTALERLTAKAVFDPLAWLRRYAPRSVPARYAPYHRKLVEMPEPGHAQLRAVYRGAAKTTVIRGLVVHGAIRRKARGILLVVATYGKAKEHRQALARLARLAGVSVSTDAEQNLVVIGDVPIWTHTPGGAVRGINWINPATGETIRPNWLIVDDLETRDSARSATQTQEREDWLFSDAMATDESAHPMSTVLLGTPITPNSIVARAMRREPPYEVWDEPLIVPYEDADGNPAWPGQHDPTRRQRTPAITMATEYDMNPLPPGTLLFPEEATAWRDVPAGPFPAVLAVDPAGDGPDATAAALVSLTERGLHVVDAIVFDGQMFDAPAAVVTMCERARGLGWEIAAGLVEAVGVAKYVTRELQRELWFTVTSETPRGGKIDRMLPLTVWHAAGAVSMAPHLKGTRFDLEVHSITQAGQTVTGHDDAPDVLAWACAPLTNGWRTEPPVMHVAV